MEKVVCVDLDMREFRQLILDVINTEDSVRIRDEIKIYQALFWFIFSHGYHFWFIALLKQQKLEWAGEPLTKEQKETLIEKFNLIDKDFIISNGLLSVYEETMDKVSDIQGNIRNPFLKRIMPMIHWGASIFSWILIAGCILVRPTMIPLALVIWLIIGAGFEKLLALVLQVWEQQLRQYGAIRQGDLIIKSVNQSAIKSNTVKYVETLTEFGLVDKKYFRFDWFDLSHDSLRD